MKRRIALFVSAALLGAIVMVLPAASPAAALPNNACAGVGFANTPPLTYIVTPAGLMPPADGGYNFSLDTGVCATSGSLAANGRITGWCGLSGGDGVANGTHRFHFIGVGSMLVVTGELIGVVNGTPDLVFTGQSCLSGAVRFIVTGAVLGVTCSAGVNLWWNTIPPGVNAVAYLNCP